MKSCFIVLTGIILILSDEKLYCQNFPQPVLFSTTPGRLPTASPDGQWVAYINFVDKIVKLRTDRSAIRTLADGNASQLEWSRTSDSILVRGGSALGILDANTGELSFLGVFPINNGATWSPLGNEIAAQASAGGILIISYPEGSSSILPCTDPDRTLCEGEHPVWSPDGEWIAFEDGIELLKVPRAGGTARIVVNKLRDISEPSWSPDGKWIAMSVQANDGPNEYWHIWVTDARGQQFGLWQVTDGPYSDGYPTWSADSKTIYFDSNRNGFKEIWQVKFNRTTSVEAMNETISGFSLHQNHPNPFNPMTEIRYDLPKPAQVKLVIYNLLGEKVRTLVDAIQPAGIKRARWDGMDEVRHPLASGVYLYRLEAGGMTQTRRMLLIH